MPAKSKAQRRLMSIALHHPEKLYSRNRAVLNMAKSELRKFAATKEKGLKARKRAVDRLKRKMIRK